LRPSADAIAGEQKVGDDLRRRFPDTGVRARIDGMDAVILRTGHADHIWIDDLRP